MGASRADAEEIAQESMIAAWQKWESIREPAAWVRTTAVRKLWRHRQHQPELPLEENAVLLPAGESDLAIFTEEQQQVVRLLRQLPDAQRTVAALHYDGLTTDEIAAATGKPAQHGPVSLAARSYSPQGGDRVGLIQARGTQTMNG